MDQHVRQPRFQFRNDAAEFDNFGPRPDDRHDFQFSHRASRQRLRSLAPANGRAPA
jgi:hypothetical protein